VIFFSLFFFYVASCLYFHYRGFKAGFESEKSLSPVQTGEDKVY